MEKLNNSLAEMADNASENKRKWKFDNFTANKYTEFTNFSLKYAWYKTLKGLSWKIKIV